MRPYAEGGQATEDKIQLRCRAHTAYEAVLHFGELAAAGVRERQGAYPVRTEFEQRDRGLPP